MASKKNSVWLPPSMWEWKQRQQMLNNIPLSNTGQVYTLQPQYTSGAMTFTQPTFTYEDGHIPPVAVPVSPVQQVALPAAKEDPLAWLDRRVGEVCRVGALQ